MIKKKEMELKLVQERERQYDSMFRPSINKDYTNPTIQESQSVAMMSSNPLERSELLYQLGREKSKKQKDMSQEDLLRLEREYDENLTFQPVINKSHPNLMNYDGSQSARGSNFDNFGRSRTSFNNTSALRLPRS